MSGSRQGMTTHASGGGTHQHQHHHHPNQHQHPHPRAVSYGSYGSMGSRSDDRTEEGDALLGGSEAKVMDDGVYDSPQKQQQQPPPQPQYTAGFLDDLDEVAFPASPMRFVVSGLLFLSCMLNCYIEYTFVAIWSVGAEAYNVGPLEINSLALVFALFYVPGSIIAIGLYAKYGLSSCINGSTLLNFASCWVRYIGSALFLKTNPQAAYLVVLVGHCLAALGSPLVGNAPTRLANDWFPEAERDLAVSIMTQAFSVGGGFGALFPVYQVHHPEDIPGMLFWQAVFSTFLLMASVAWVPYAPPAHAGLDAAYQAILRDGAAASGLGELLAQMWKDFSDMMADLTFVVLLIAFSLEVGVSWALASVVGQLVQPCGYSNTVVGVLSIGCGFSGVFGSFGTAWVLQRYPDSILTVQKVMLVLTAGTALWCLAVNRPGHFGQLVAPWVLYGLASGPLVPVTLGLAAEITYPIPADNSAALLFTGAITVFFVVTILLTALLRLPTSQSCSNLVTPASVMLTLLVLVGAGIALPMRIGQLQRRELMGGSDKGPKTSDAAPVDAQPLGPGPGQSRGGKGSGLGTIREEEGDEDDSGGGAIDDDDGRRVQRASKIFGKYYAASSPRSPGGSRASGAGEGYGSAPSDSDLDRDFDIGELVDREIGSPGWVRKKPAAAAAAGGVRKAVANGTGAGTGNSKNSISSSNSTGNGTAATAASSADGSRDGDGDGAGTMAGKSSEGLALFVAGRL